MAVSVILASTGCNKGGDETEAAVSVEPTTVETTEEPQEEFKLFSDEVFTKDQIQAKIDSGLSDNWEPYQLNAVLANIDGLPDNVKESIKNAFGEYKWDNYEIPDFNGKWENYMSASDQEAEKIHAVMDLYGVSPDMEMPVESRASIDKRVESNPSIDLSQYATYEDGDAFIPYFSYYGCEVLAQNDHIKIEGVRDITIEP